MEENIIQVNGEIKINVGVSVKCHKCETDYIWNPSTCSCEYGKYLTSITEDSAILCDKVMESFDKETKTIPTSFSEKKVFCKTQNVYILLEFLLITIA